MVDLLILGLFLVVYFLVLPRIPGISRFTWSPKLPAPWGRKNSCGEKS